MPNTLYEGYTSNFVSDVSAPTPPLSVRPYTEDSASTITSKKFSYHFGIDSINFSQVRIEQNMCFISEDIEIGYLKEDEYIQLTAEFDTGENGAIEFYVIDSSDPKSILPIGTEVINNEKIFFGLRPRFSINNNEAIIIKKNGVIVDVSLDQAINSNEDGYTISYSPLDSHDLVIKNNTIKIKAILRTYDKNGEAPFIKRLAIKKYGRNSLWKDNIIN